MKKLIALLLAAVMCLSLAACGGNKQLEGLQKEIYDAALEIGCKEVTSGYEYKLDEFEMADGSNQAFTLLLLVADGASYIVDREDGKIYGENDVDWNYEVSPEGFAAFETKAQVFSMFIQFNQSIPNSGALWTEWETLTELAGADLEAVNNQLGK